VKRQTGKRQWSDHNFDFSQFHRHFKSSFAADTHFAKKLQSQTVSREK